MRAANTWRSFVWVNGDVSLSLLVGGRNRLCGEHAIDLDERVEDESEGNDDPDEVGSVSKPKVKQVIKSELLWVCLRVAVSKSGVLKEGKRGRRRTRLRSMGMFLKPENASVKKKKMAPTIWKVLVMMMKGYFQVSACLIDCVRKK